MKDTLLIEPHYLGSLEYFVLLKAYPKITLEVNAHFTKQTYKNRTVFMTSHGPVNLTVPVKFGNRTPYKDVRIEYRQSWVREHWGAFFSAYGKAPFFEFFADHFQQAWNKQPEFLLDLNLDLMSICLKFLQIDRSFEFTGKYEKKAKNDFYDLREQIHPKKPFEERKIYLPFRYTQLFGSKFAPNLSIVDLLMCEGTQSAEVLSNSTLDVGEHL